LAERQWSRSGTRSFHFIGMERLLSEQEREVRERELEFLDCEVVPVAVGYWGKAEFPFDLLF